MKNPQKPYMPLKEFLTRGSAMLLTFLALVLYLFLVQSAYDEAEKGSITRAFLFATTIFGAGLTWDVTKHIGSLNFDNLNSFIHSMRKTVVYALGYLISSAFAFSLTNTLAGPLTITLPLAVFAAAFCCLQVILRGSEAIESATK